MNLHPEYGATRFVRIVDCLAKLRRFVYGWSSTSLVGRYNVTSRQKQFEQSGDVAYCTQGTNRLNYANIHVCD